METKNKVRINKEVTNEFWTSTGVRQGCPLSPALFNVYVFDLEETMKEGQLGGIVVGNSKIWTLSYADDIALIAKSEEELKYMMKRFEKYLKKKELLLSPGKSKVLVFEKGKGKKKMRKWSWGKESVEEVKEIKYLGYILQKKWKM